MHYQLFFPDPQAQTTSATLAKFGLSDLEEGANYWDTAKGPDGMSGCGMAWPTPKSPHVGYLPAEQVWEKSPDGYWIGYWKESPVTPEDLQRANQFPSHTLSLGDGNTWMMPVAAELPKRFIRKPDGRWCRVLLQEFQDLWEKSELWYRRLLLASLSESAIQISDNLTEDDLDQEWNSFVLQALRLNYRILPDVAVKLGLLTTSNRILATVAILDGVQIAEVIEQKKTLLSATTRDG